MPRLAVLTLALLGALAAAPVAADTFRALLGGRVLGTLEFSAGRLTTVLDNTPLGVADGRFTGRTQRVTHQGRRVVQYTGDSASPREQRRIAVLLDQGRVLDTTIDPAGERTALSDPAAVPPGVIDPVTAFGVMVGAGDCPQAFRMYDGRRVIEVRPQSRSAGEGRIICRMRYDVVAGPGHLSPFRFTRLTLDLTYGGGQLLAMDIATGPFALRLAR